MTTPWPTSGPRRISLSSFGYGGSNGHVVLDDAFHYCESHSLQANHITTRETRTLSELPSDESSNTSVCSCDPSDTKDPGDNLDLPSAMRSLDFHHCDSISSSHTTPSKTTSRRLLALTSSDEQGIQRSLSAIEAHIKDLAAKDLTVSHLENILYTLCCRRSRLPWRAFGVLESSQDLIDGFKGVITSPVRASNPTGLVFVFTGQGAQWHTMGRELLKHDVFRRHIQAADAYLRLLGATWSLEGK